jgi:hypothetical protein
MRFLFGHGPLLPPLSIAERALPSWRVFTLRTPLVPVFAEIPACSDHLKIPAETDLDHLHFLN